MEFTVVGSRTEKIDGKDEELYPKLSLTTNRNDKGEPILILWFTKDPSGRTDSEFEPSEACEHYLMELGLAESKELIRLLSVTVHEMEKNGETQ